MRATAAVLALLAACGGSSFQSRDADVHRAIENLAGDLARMRKQIEEDDAALGRAMAERSLSTEPRRSVENFVSDRRAALRRFEAHLTELEAVDREMHRAEESGADEAARKAVNERSEKAEQERKAIRAEFEALDRRDAEIKEMLRRAPKK